MTSIQELLIHQENTMIETPPEEKEQAQQVSGYSSEEVINSIWAISLLLKASLNIHWQQTTELTAQAVHLERWGYKKLASVLKADAEEEHEHCRINLERLEFFDADYQPLIVQPRVWKRHDIKALIEFNLEGVRNAAQVEIATITEARNIEDEITANIMIPLLQGSDDGIKLYEGYLKLIEQMGLENFLTLQV